MVQCYSKVLPGAARYLISMYIIQYVSFPEEKTKPHRHGTEALLLALRHMNAGKQHNRNEV